MSVRSEVADLLRPQLPADWLILPYRPTETNLGRVSVWMSQRSVERRGDLARGIDQTSLVATLVEPTRDPETADDRLEANLDLLLDALDNLTGITRGTAERGVTSDDGGYPGYDITLTLTTSRRKD